MKVFGILNPLFQMGVKPPEAPSFPPVPIFKDFAEMDRGDIIFGNRGEEVKGIDSVLRYIVKKIHFAAFVAGKQAEKRECVCDRVFFRR